MRLKKIAAIGAAFGVAIAGFGLGAAAHADPVTDGYAVVGSDTLQDAVWALTNGTGITGSSVKATGNGSVAASWDAFTLGVSGGVGSIQTKAFGPVFDRPNGSGAGRKALLASFGGTSGSAFTFTTGVNSYNTSPVNIQGQVDLSRSSSVASTGATSVAGGVLTYVPFGQDAISFIYKVGSGSASDVTAATSFVSNLTKAQLLSIYTGSSTTPISGTAFSVQPMSLQASSGTWKTFLSKIGISGGVTLGAGVLGGASNTTTPENDGRVLAPAANTVEIIPVSVANYVGQVNNAARINTFAGVSVGSIEGVAPFTGTAPNLVPNATYYNSSDWGRTVFIVVRSAALDSTNAAFDQGVSDLVDTTQTTSLTYWGASALAGTSKAVKAKFGFSAPQTAAFTAND
ncbi:hypothetical protein ABCS02_08570 [Microbacterium sp. X-17]|uniref:hypothetical protein n=1 Tax=Microbacterium sp. X-17 TaxID=3144404 RepID=UPI0031F4DC2F